MMRALTLTQPWCGLVASGIKLVENRPRRPPLAMIGQRFALHASREIDEGVYSRIYEIAPEFAPDDPLMPPGAVRSVWHDRWHDLSRITSAVIGTAVFDRVVWEQEVGQMEVFATEHLDIPSSLPTAQRRWFFGKFGYVLRDVQTIEKPVPCKGALGFWALGERDAELVQQQGRS